MIFPADFIFRRWQPEDGGYRLTFSCAAPGPGLPTDYEILLTDTDLATVTTALQLRTLAQTALERKVRAATIAAKLDPFIGQTVTVS